MVNEYCEHGARVVPPAGGPLVSCGALGGSKVVRDSYHHE
jgi:hypothetical protein